MDNLYFEDLQCSESLKDSNTSTEEAKLLFQFRTIMYSVKNNFKERYQGDLTCKLCAYANET